jgi:hypothetical protein
MPTVYLQLNPRLELFELFQIQNPNEDLFKRFSNRILIFNHFYNTKTSLTAANYIVQTSV